jgi:hypothetical protein
MYLSGIFISERIDFIKKGLNTEGVKLLTLPPQYLTIQEYWFSKNFGGGIVLRSL